MYCKNKQTNTNKPSIISAYAQMVVTSYFSVSGNIGSRRLRHALELSPVNVLFKFLDLFLHKKQTNNNWASEHIALFHHWR